MQDFSELTGAEQNLFKKLSTPNKIQDYLNGLVINFEGTGETLRSPRRVMRDRTAHCLEGALLAAAALWFHDEPPLLLDLKTGNGDNDHVVALFRRHGRWGAISKTNHAVLRYREPIYKNVRELALSYFHEYFLDDGRKTLRTYSWPFDLRRFQSRDWLTDESDLWYISKALDRSPHVAIAPTSTVRKYRLAEPVEILAGRLTEWAPNGRRLSWRLDKRERR
ncbi:MAG TPA: hypothetical protein VMC43_03555 [Candidatus Paceibacterota bacterium]|nr:hypothetical protein [Candidatus Paceibacterota bacterium]